MGKNIIRDLLDTSSKSIKIILEEINQQFGCDKCISKDILYRWINQKVSSSNNKKLSSVIYFCLYFNLTLEQIEEVLDFLKITLLAQRISIITTIENLKGKQAFIFYGYDSLQLTNFVRNLENYNLHKNVDISFKEKDTEIIKNFNQVNLSQEKDFYIRDVKVNDLLVGGDNASQGLSMENLTIYLDKTEVEPILTESYTNHFNLYAYNNNFKIPVSTLLQLNQLEHILALIKKQEIQTCPLAILVKILDKKISSHLEESVFESFRTLKIYFKLQRCNINDIYNAIDFLGIKLNKYTYQNLVTSQIYIIEALGYLAMDNKSKSAIWKVAYDFFITKKNYKIQHPHILWAFLVLLDNTKQYKYEYKHKALVQTIEEMVNDYSCNQQEFYILQTKLYSLKVFFNM